jgi:hypothetical protein
MENELKELKTNEVEENCQLLDTFLIRQGGRGNMQADLWFYESHFNMQFEIIEKIHKLKGVHYIIGGGIEVCEDCPYKMHPCPEGCSKKV